MTAWHRKRFTFSWRRMRPATCAAYPAPAMPTCGTAHSPTRISQPGSPSKTSSDLGWLRGNCACSKVTFRLQGN